MNSSVEKTPKALKNGLVLEMNINAVEESEVGKLIPIKGTAKLFTSNTINLNTVYNLYYGEGYEPTNWIKIGEEKRNDIRNGLLGVWDSRNLNSGTYTMKMDYIIGNGEPITVARSFYLGENTENNQTLNIPHIANDIQWETSLIFDNSNSNGETVSGIFYENSKESSSFSNQLDPNKSFTYIVPSGECGIVNCSEGVDIRVVYSNRFERGIAEFLLSPETGNEIYLLTPSYNSSNLTWMGVALMNPGNIGANTVLNAYNADGEMLQSINMYIEPKSRDANLLSNWFTETQWQNIAYIKVISDKPVTGITISGKNNKQLLFGKAIRAGFEGSVFIPHIANQWTEWENLLIFTNTSLIDEEISFTLYSNGNVVTNIDSYSIPAGSTKTINLNDYSSFDPQCGTISVTSDSVICRQSFRNATQLGTAEFILNNSVGENVSALFPQYASFQLNWMGLAVFNSEKNSSNLTLTAIYDGESVGTTTLQINGFSKSAILLSDLFSEIPFNEINKIEISSDKQMSIISISGMNQEQLLFVPGVVKK